MLLLGTAGMFLCIGMRRNRFPIKLWQGAAFTVLLTVVGVAGAMLMFYLESGSFGGVSFYGSVFLIPMLMPLIGIFFRLKPGQVMDLCGPSVAIMIGCMRFNCVLNNCCGGWQVCLGSLCFSWPTQAMDSIGDFAIMLWLLQLEREDRAKGVLYPSFMIAYSMMRFLLEFLRDTPKDWMYLSHGQWFAFAAIVAGLLWIVLQKRRSSVR